MPHQILTLQMFSIYFFLCRRELNKNYDNYIICFICRFFSCVLSLCCRAHRRKKSEAGDMEQSCESNKLCPPKNKTSYKTKSKSLLFQCIFVWFDRIFSPSFLVRYFIYIIYRFTLLLVLLKATQQKKRWKMFVYIDQIGWIYNIYPVDLMSKH